MMVIYHDFRRYFHIVLHRNESSFIVSSAYVYILQEYFDTQLYITYCKIRVKRFKVYLKNTESERRINKLFEVLKIEWKMVGNEFIAKLPNSNAKIIL